MIIVIDEALVTYNHNSYCIIFVYIETSGCGWIWELLSMDEHLASCDFSSVE